MSLRDSIVKWFIRYAWPEIKKLIIEFAAVLADRLFEKTKKALREYFAKRTRQAEEHVAEAERAAQAAKSDIERARQEAKAEVWREVVCDLRHGNEELRDRLSQLLNETKEAHGRHLDGLESTDVFDLSNDQEPRAKDALLMLPPPDQEIIKPHGPA
jgi:hypothetical protein